MITLAPTNTLQAVATNAATVTYTVFGIELAGATDTSAGTVKPLSQGQIAASAAAIYTAPAGGATMVKEIHLSNQGGSAQVVSLFVNGTAGTNKINSLSVPANGTVTYDGRWTVYDSLGYPQTSAMSEIQKANLYITGPRPWADVVAYGADPTGQADSYAAFTAALAAANTAHGWVYVPPGDFYISAALTVPAFTRISGAGQYQSRIIPHFTTGNVLTVGGGCVIEDLWIIGVSSTTTAGGTLSATPQTITFSSAIGNQLPTSGTGYINLANGTWTTVTWTGTGTSSITGATGSGVFNSGANMMARSSGAAIDTGINSLVMIRGLRIDQMYNGIVTGGVLVQVVDSHVRNCVNCHVLCNVDDGTPVIRNLTTDNDYAQAAAGFRQTQGSVVMSDTQIMRSQIGLDFPVAAGGIFSPFVKNCFLDNCGTAAMSITGPGSPNVFDRGKFEMVWFSSSVNGAVLNNTGIRGCDFDNSDFYLNSANGLQILAAGEVGVNFSRFAQNTTAGINGSVTGGTPDIAVMNCLIGPVSTALTGNGQGVILSGTLGNLRIAGNNLSGNTGAALNDTSTVVNPAQKLITDNSGLSVAPVPMTVTPATFAAETVVHTMYLPANSLIVGTTIRVRAAGIITGTGPTVTARLRLGAAGTTADTQVCASAAGAVTTGAGWNVDGLITIRSIGAAGTALGNIGIFATTASAGSPQTATVAVDTTVARILSLTITGGGTSPLVTVPNAAFEVLKQ